MLSNSKEIFSKLSEALYSAGLYVSFADVKGDKKAWKAELTALHMLMDLLSKENSEDSLLHELALLAKGELQRARVELSDEDVNVVKDILANTPQIVEEAVYLAAQNLSKTDARLYTDMLVSAAASAAQAYDEKDNFFLTGNLFVDALTFPTNTVPIFERIVMFFSNLHADKNAKYLYEENDLFDQMKISTRESDALGKIVVASRNSWLSVYPEDKEQTVQDYIERNGKK